jgi:hypothetical protein
VKLAAMQPYFFPYLGHFDLANQADMWIVYDVAQYIRHGWVNRNRVLHPTSGWQYIVVPVRKHRYTAPINQIEIVSEIDWKTSIFRKLQHYHMDAPCYSEVIRFLGDCFSGSECNLARLNVDLFRRTCRCLGIGTPIHVVSEMNLTLAPAHGPEELALSLCQAVGASEYINPPGGAALYNADRFVERGITLTIQSFENMPYDCGRFRYEPALSIIDVMMWNSPGRIKHYLETWRLHGPGRIDTEWTAG